MAFDVSSSTNPIYVAGRDSGGSQSGENAGYTYSLITNGDTLYMGKVGNATACSQTAGSAIGCELMAFDISADLAGTMTGTSAFNDVSIYGSIRVAASASTTDLTNNGFLTAPTTTLSIAGDYTNNGIFNNASGTVVMSGAVQQTATGTLSGTSAFNNLTVSNQSGNGTTSRSVTFGAPLTVSDTSTITASTSVAFVAGATTTISTAVWQGSAGSPIYLRSTATGTASNLTITGTRSVSYADVRDSNATSTSGGILATNSSNSGNNTNWTFGAASGPVWNAIDWTLYDTITIDHTKVDADLTDFPVYVDLADLSPQFWSTVTSGGGDIRVTTNSGSPVELAREVVSASTTLETGELHFKANSISSTTDTVFRIYYNGVAANYANSDTYGAQNVWTNDYVAVYHLGENPGGGTDALRDSTQFANHGTAVGNGVVASSSLVMGNAIDLAGTDDYIEIPSSNSFDFSDKSYSVSWWGNYRTLPTSAGLFSKGTTSSVINDFVLQRNGAGFSVRHNSASAQATFPTAVADYIGVGRVHSAATYSSADVYVLFKNGTTYVSTTSVTTAPSFTANRPVKLGAERAGASLDGTIDEFRFSSSTRSAAWVSAEYVNQATTTEFYTVNQVVDNTGSSTISNHTAGQVGNTFNAQAKTNESLFAFRLTPNSGNATVTDAVISITGVQGFNPFTSLTNLRLYRDLDNDAQYDAADTQVGGAGVIAGAGQNGTITFSTDFLSTTSQNYLVVADWSAPANGTFMTLDLYPSGLSIIDATSSQNVFGSVSAIQHSRNNRGAGGRSSSIGGDAPAGNGTTTGGGQTGGGVAGPQDGSNIEPNPDFYRPSGQSGDWSNGANALVSDGVRATAAGAAIHTFSGFGFSLPADNTVQGIEIKLDSRYGGVPGTIAVEVSWNGGTNYTSSGKVTPTLTLSDVVYTLGAPSDLWGRTWSPSEFSDANFRVRITGSNSTIDLDALEIRVFHQSSGGSQGGGGGGGGI
jgi:Concanavalin A-like lectin/glucanases superfamily